MSRRSVLIYDENSNIAGIDPFSQHLILIDAVHYRVHNGEMFQADRVGLGVSNNATVEVLIRVPADVGAHMAFSVRAGGDARLQLFENPTVTADGTPVAAANRNRFSSNITIVLAFHTPTTTVDGTLLSDVLVAGGSGGNSAGGDTESFAEWILKSSEEYLVRATNIAGTAQNVGLELDWYQDGAAPP